MTSHPDDRSVLFADICGSTAFYERLGDAQAHQLIGQTLALMSEEVAAKGGYVVKTIGDEVMACFWHPVHALDAAKAMLLRLASLPGETGQPLVAAHMGLTHGPVVHQGGDLFGDAVNIAARLTALAKPWQILTTAQTIAALGPRSEEVTRQVTRAPLKGKSEEMDIFEVVWEQEGLTRSTPTARLEVTSGRLLLKFRDKQVEVTPARPVATLGRGAQNDLVASDKGVSRWHARIELRRGKWVLVDRSTNGTFVHAQEREPVFVNYEEYLLPPSGHLTLGGKTDPERRVTVFFQRG